MGKFIDLTGMTFGRLTVIGRAENHVTANGNVFVKWKCKCNCDQQTEVIVFGNALTHGRTKSCGCLQAEARYKTNTYDLSGEYGVGYTSNGEKFYFDLDDYDKIKNYSWHTNNGYIISDTRNGILQMHRLVMNVYDSAIKVDHIKHRRYDNRKSQLRIVNDSQNSMNKPLASNNTSGVTGVAFDNISKKWKAYIQANKEFIHLGYFSDFNQAVKIRKEAEEKYFGQYSYSNSMQGD